MDGQRPEVSRHKCLIYEGHPSEQLPVVVPLLLNGLVGNWRCLYLGDPDSVHMVESALIGKGIDTDREARRGALVMSSERDHLSGGAFDPLTMVDGLRAMIDEAVRDGFQGLCATGDMMWELGDEENFDRLLEYEALLEQVFYEKPLQGICQYRRDVVPPRAVNEALLTHRSAYIGRTLSDNIFFMPPETVLASKDRAVWDVQGEWMCEQLLRVMKAEQNRDRALASLRESEALQRQLAESLADANRELELRVRQRTADLEASNRELEAFSYSVSHDLRAPLRSINTLSTMLTEEFREVLGEDGRGFIERIRGSASRMNELIDGMLGLARVSKAELRLEAVDLSEIAKMAYRDLRQADPERNVEVVIPEGLIAYGDRRLLGSVVENLLGNAWKFTSKRPSARIEVGRDEAANDRDVFFVKDDGAGFDMKYAHNLFGTGNRLHTQQEFPGTGIGLATVQRIILRHEGEIWAEGRPDEGALFSFALPRQPSNTVSAAGD